MFDILLQSLNKMFDSLLGKRGIRYGKFGLINDITDNLEFNNGKCEQCSHCLQYVKTISTYKFQNRNCFPSSVYYCVRISIINRKNSVGIVILGYEKKDAQLVDFKIIEHTFTPFIKFIEQINIRKKISLIAKKKWGKQLIMIGNSSSIINLEKKVKQFSESHYPVLITGESGTGKELFARMLYLTSGSLSRPFISINCGALQNKELLRSEMFGFTKGSFTGATREQEGFFKQAKNGMLFLDEIGQFPVEFQPTLLRVLESGEVHPIGGNIDSINFRLICASNVKLEKLVDEKKFREDLYYRINVLNIHIPPLRERENDWQIIAEYFIYKLNKLTGQRKRLSKEVLEALSKYNFPGNIRELRNIIISGYYSSFNETINLNDIIEKMQFIGKIQEDNDMESQHFRMMVEKGHSFWQVVKKPYLYRELNRYQVKQIIQMGLYNVGNNNGKYKRLLSLFNLPLTDYKRFLNFINKHNLNSN